MITILDVAYTRLGKSGGNLTGGDFESVGLQIMGGCEGCGASLAAYNAYPSTTGYWRCRDCLCGAGFKTVEEFEKAELRAAGWRDAP